MIQSKEYLTQEYREKAKGFVAVETKFTHTFNIKTDSKNEIVRRNDFIKVSLKFVDKDMNPLFNTFIVFENNLIPKRFHKSFINISPKELENRFNIAKNEICREILNEYIEKKNELETKIKNLKNYNNVSLSVIPSEFRGESISIVNSNDTFGGPCFASENTKKSIFEM